MPIKNIRTGHQVLKKRLVGPLEARYYPEDIAPVVRKINPGWTTEIQQRRLDKLEILRRRGKGPPKKGAGKRKKK